MDLSTRRIPSRGTKIDVALMFISKCCGTILTGYLALYDDGFIHLCETSDGTGHIEKIHINGITDIKESSPDRPVCVRI